MNVATLASWWNSPTIEIVRAVVFSIFDVAVVAFLVYRSLVLIRGTRAQQILIGLGTLLVAFVCAKFFGLRTLSWIMDNFMSSFLLIVIVVFQHDIRRVLSRVGKRSFFGEIEYGRGAFLVEETSRACMNMQMSKLGALIVIEREAELTELAETGLRVDGRITAELLEQIFTPEGPLHDGAVIVQQGRVTSARVVLPLSQSAHLDPQLGTRHRAAVGVTEEYDCVAIVVSEETGKVSLAQGGVLTRDIDGPTLRQVLFGYFGATRKTAV
jgi:diadenylate cyclase